jgi:hypothetical protein
MTAVLRSVAEATGRGLAELEEDFALDWPVFAAAAGALAVLTVGLLRILQAVTLRSDNLVVNLVGVAPGLVLAAGALALLGWVYWRVRLNAAQRGPYLLALLAGVITVGVCVEAFAGLTALLLRRGAVAAQMPTAASLWSLEQYYLWQLVDALPLLGITQTLGWAAPVSFTDQLSGSLTLLFRLLLLVPLVRVALSGYQLAQSAWLAHAESHAHDERRTSRLRSAFGVSAAGRAAGIVAGLLGLAALLTVALAVLGQGHGALDRWAVARFDEAAAALGLTLSATWIPLALDVVLAIVAVGVVGVQALSLVGYSVGLVEAATPKRRMLVALLLSLGLLVLGLLAAAVITVTLLHVGVARAEPALAPAGDARAVLGWYGWHLVNAIPVMEAPRFLHWTPTVQLVDGFSASLLLTLRVALVATLAGPFALVVQGVLRQAARRRPLPGQLEAVRTCVRALHRAQAVLDVAQGGLVAELSSGTRAAGVRRVAPATGPTTPASALRAVDAAQRQVEALFGAGPAADALRDAVVALHARSRAVIAVRWELFELRRRGHPGGDDLVRGLEEGHDDAARLIAAFQTAAGEALRAAARGAGPLCASQHSPTLLGEMP